MQMYIHYADLVLIGYERRYDTLEKILNIMTQKQPQEVCYYNGMHRVQRIVCGRIPLC